MVSSCVTRGNEWVPNPPQLSQISALAEAQCGDKSAPDKDYPEAYHIKGVVKELEGGLVVAPLRAQGF